MVVLLYCFVVEYLVCGYPEWGFLVTGRVILLRLEERCQNKVAENKERLQCHKADGEDERHLEGSFLLGVCCCFGANDTENQTDNGCEEGKDPGRDQQSRPCIGGLGLGRF